MVICYKYPYDLHNYTAFEDTEVRFLNSLLLLQLNNHKKRKRKKRKNKIEIKKEKWKEKKTLPIQRV